MYPGLEFRSAPNLVSGAVLGPVLDILATGVAVVTVDSELVYANSSASLSLKNTLWKLQDSTVINTNPNLNEDWRKLLRTTVLQQVPSVLEVECAGEVNFIVTHPLRVAENFLVVVHFEPVAAGRDEAAQLFGHYYRLTSTEISVLNKLFKGIRPAAIAKDHGVAPSTVETQIAMIRSKTDCNSVNSVLAKLARFPALKPVARTPNFATMRG
jgi:DNA-binding CsgD family transcriptional regulator